MSGETVAELREGSRRKPDLIVCGENVLSAWLRCVDISEEKEKEMVMVYLSILRSSVIYYLYLWHITSMRTFSFETWLLLCH